MPHPTKPLHAITEIVVDASAIVDLLLGNELVAPLAGGSRATLCMHQPISIPRFSPLWAGCTTQATSRPKTSRGSCKVWPLYRSSGTLSVDLLVDSWARRHQLRLVDDLYIQLAVSLGLRLITTDGRLQDVPAADVVVA